MPDTAPCPCGSNLALAQCCGRYLSRACLAPNAEALLRSRYTAYVLKDLAYLKATWHPEHLPADFEIASQREARWLGLSIKHRVTQDATHEKIEFVARYKIQGRAYRLHEISLFERCGDQWLYRVGVAG